MGPRPAWLHIPHTFHNTISKWKKYPVGSYSSANTLCKGHEEVKPPAGVTSIPTYEHLKIT